MPLAAVIRFPGSNCEFETAAALRHSGIDARIYNWNETESLLNRRAEAYILPGGVFFSGQSTSRSDGCQREDHGYRI